MRTAEWRGWIAALRAGWSFDWKQGRTVFLCPDQHPADPDTRTLLRQKKELHNKIVALLDVSPFAYLQFTQHGKGLNPHTSKPWQWRHGTEPREEAERAAARLREHFAARGLDVEIEIISVRRPVRAPRLRKPS